MPEHDPEKWEPDFGKDHVPVSETTSRGSCTIGLTSNRWWTLRGSYEILIFQTAVQKQDAASNRKESVMLRTVFATVFLTGLTVAQCPANEACPAADDYVKPAAKIGDRDLATAIACLAEKLPDEGAQSTPADTGPSRTGSLRR